MQVNLAKLRTNLGGIFARFSARNGNLGDQNLGERAHQDPDGILGRKQNPGGQNLGRNSRQVPAGILGAKRNPGGQNLGGIPVVIPPRSCRDSRRGAKTRRPKSRRAIPPALSARSEIPVAKISAGSRR